MVFSRIAELVSAATSHFSTPKSSTIPYAFSGVLPLAGSVHGFGFASSGQKNNLRYFSSLQDFSAYRQLDPEDDNLDPGTEMILPHPKQPHLLPRENGGTSFSKEKASPAGPFVRKKWVRVMILLFLLLFALFIYMLHFFYSNWSQRASKFYVVLDYGSTGTRVYVYQAVLNHKKDGNLPILVKSLPEGIQKKLSSQSF